MGTETSGSTGWREAQGGPLPESLEGRGPRLALALYPSLLRGRVSWGQGSVCAGEATSDCSRCGLLVREQRVSCAWVLLTAVPGRGRFSVWGRLSVREAGWTPVGQGKGAFSTVLVMARALPGAPFFDRLIILNYVLVI